MKEGDLLKFLEDSRYVFLFLGYCSCKCLDSVGQSEALLMVINAEKFKRKCVC